MATIHHATRARAEKLGFEIFEREGMFALKRLSDEAVSRHSREAAKDLLTDEFLVGTDWVLPNVEEDGAPRRNRSGMMVLTYHTRYMANGGGCGDSLDEALRGQFTRQVGKERTLDLEALRTFGEELGLWNHLWNEGNPGHCRMNLANRLRGKLRNDANFEVTIGGQTGRFGVEFLPPARKAKKAEAA